jgi:hypothetical protein
MPTAFLQCFSNGRSPEEVRFVEKELAARPAGSVRTVKVLEEDVPTSEELVFSRGDFAVGNATFVKKCLARAGVPLPPAPDYPACLEPLLHRRLWRATLGACEERAGGAPFFVKPAEDIKAFSGEEATPAELAHLRSRFPASFPVVCSERVDIACEYRVYVARGVVLAVAHCPHPGCEKAAGRGRGARGRGHAAGQRGGAGGLRDRLLRDQKGGRLFNGAHGGERRLHDGRVRRSERRGLHGDG